MSPRTAAAARRNTSSAKATAAFAPPRSRGDLQSDQGISGHRHRHGVADARRRVPVRRRPLRARRRAAIAVAGRHRARAHGHVQQGGAGAGRALRADRVSDHARRAAAERRCRESVLRAGRADDRIAGGRRRPIARLHPRRLRQEPARRRAQDRQPLRRDVRGRRSPSRDGAIARGPDPMLDGVVARLWRRLRRLCARRARLQDRDDLHLLASEVSGKWDWDDGSAARRRASPKICASCWRSPRRSG